MSVNQKKVLLDATWERDHPAVPAFRQNAADHRWTKARNKSVGVCARIRSSSRCLVQRLVSFKSFALSVLTFIGSVAEPYKAAIAAENIALQKLSAGPLHTLPAGLLRRRSTCGLNIDVDCIQVTSKAARFRVASRSDVLSAGMAHIRAAKGHGGRTLDSSTRSWDDLYLPRLLPFTPPLFFRWSTPWIASGA